MYGMVNYIRYNDTAVFKLYFVLNLSTKYIN